MNRGPKPRPIEERFWEKVDKNGPTQPHMTTPCWVWTGTINKQTGYGQFAMDGKRRKAAHIVAWLLTRGPIPPGKKILHECDHRPCVRHTYAGTPLDNSNDMRRRGRAATGDRHWKRRHPGRSGGLQNPNAKLTPEDIEEIRAAYASGEASQEEIARVFGVTQGNVSAIVRRKTWAEVPAAV